MTETHGISDGLDRRWGHVTDLRSVWKHERAWVLQDFEAFKLENQPLGNSDGLFVVFFSFYLESPPENTSFLEAVSKRFRAFAGDMLPD